MVFSSYKDIGAVLKKFQITYTEANFIEEVEFGISDLHYLSFRFQGLPVLLSRLGMMGTIIGFGFSTCN
jgi:hypothetical protein